MKTRTYTQEMFDITRFGGIKGFARFVWTMQKTGRLHLGTILIGIIAAIIGIVGFLSTGSPFALIFFGLGSYMVGTADGRFCVCEPGCPCDHPMSMYTDLYPEDRPAVKDDSTIVTPHDESITGDGFEIRHYLP